MQQMPLNIAQLTEASIIVKPIAIHDFSCQFPAFSLAQVITCCFEALGLAALPYSKLTCDNPLTICSAQC